jgi:hypothetical protein
VQLQNFASQNELNAARKQDKDNIHVCVSRMQLINEVPCDAQKTELFIIEIRAFNHELSSEIEMS